MKTIAIIFVLLIIGCSPKQPKEDQSRKLSNDLHPSWSSDGSTICFQSNRAGNYDIYTLEIETKKVTQLTKSDSSDTDPVWSPDNQYIVFESQRNGNSDVYLLNLETNEVKAISTESYLEIQPSWTNENEIIYAADFEGQWQLFRSRADGEKEQLTTASRDHLTPAPGNKPNEILYSISDRGEHQTNVELMVMNLNTKESKSLTSNSGVSSNASTQLNMNVITFNTKRAGNWDIYMMNYDGTNQRSVTTNTGTNLDYEFSDLDGQPALSPDGEWIAFTSGRSGSFDICLVKIDGTVFVNLTKDWTLNN